jgi:hypothetical protein
MIVRPLEKRWGPPDDRYADKFASRLVRTSRISPIRSPIRKPYKDIQDNPILTDKEVLEVHPQILAKPASNPIVSAEINNPGQDSNFRLR